MMVCECGARMESIGMGSRRVEGETDPVHTVSYQCPECGKGAMVPSFDVAPRELPKELVTTRGRWRRTGRRREVFYDWRFRYHVRVFGWWVRVPWLAWVMFS